MGRRVTTMCLAVATAVACTVMGPVHGHAAGACTVWTDPTGDETPPVVDDDPQIDLTDGTFSVNGNTLAIRIYVADMFKGFFPWETGMEWQTQWDGPRNAAIITVDLDSSGRLTAFDIEESQTGNLHNDTATEVDGSGGYIEVDVPLDYLVLKPGDTLTNITASSNTQTEGVPIDQDSAGTGLYVVGGTC